MLDHLLGIIFQVVLVCLLIKLYPDLIIQKRFGKSKDGTNWQDAQPTIERLEKRNLQLVARESAAQEKIWKLEDENLLLRIRVRELSNIVKLEEPTPEDIDPEDEDEPRAL